MANERGVEQVKRDFLTVSSACRCMRDDEMKRLLRADIDALLDEVLEMRAKDAEQKSPAV